MDSSITPKNRVYTPENTFFDELVTMLFQIYTNLFTLRTTTILNKMSEAGKSYLAQYGWFNYPSELKTVHYPEIIGQLHSIAAGAINPNDPFTLSSRHQPYMAYYYPYRLAELICANGWPSNVEIFFGSKPAETIHPDPSLKRSFSSPQHQFLITAAIRAAFVNYYESIRPGIQSRYGDATARWPNIFRFAWIVRNACGHGGKVKIDNPNASPATWNGYSFGPSDNEQEILYGATGLSIVDIILLFEDIDAALKALDN